MKKSKVSVERYDLSFADIVKILALDSSNQKITDVSVGGGRANTSPWNITFSVETTDSTVVEVPSFVENSK